MKKLIGGIFLSCGALAAQAQTSAGTIMLGGNLGFTSGKSESRQNNNTTQPRSTSEGSGWVVAPNVGYFVTDALAVGVTASILGAKTTEHNLSLVGPAYDAKWTNKGLSVGPFVRYYIMAGEKAAFFGQLAAGYSRQEDEREPLGSPPYVYASKNTSKGSFARFTPGFAFFPIPKLGLELSFGGLDYSRNTTESSSDAPGFVAGKSTNSQFGAIFGLSSVQLGGFFYLGR